MKRIAIITPCLLPVPARKGGAVEYLITKIISDNEQDKEYYIDLFTIDDGVITDEKYSYTSIIRVKAPRFIRVADKILDKYYRTFSSQCSKRFLDICILSSFSNRLNQLNGQYDVVIVENMMSTACEILHFCSGKYDFPIYFHMHNDVDIYRSPSQIRDIARNGGLFISVSDYIKSQILKYDSHAIVTTLYNGIDFEKFERTIFYEHKDISLLYVGRIIPGKGVIELLRAFIKTIESNDSILGNRLKLIIVGFSGFDKGYESKIRRIAGKYKNIECIEKVSAEEISSIYDTADIVIMPTIDEEPFGLVSLEAMAKGIPLIVTDSGALSEVVGDGAYIVHRNDDIEKNLSDAILEVAFDRNLQKKISDRAYARARENKAFDIRNYYHGFCSIISEQDLTEKDMISVIVPVYNVKEYVEKCITSILSQTYSNMEIIIVDDGSTDGSGKICDRLSELDCRIKVIHQENQGLSAARNAGLDMASGQYIFFCDSDDYIVSDALSKMLLRLKRDHADIVACGIIKAGKDQDLVSVTDDKPGRWNGYESVIMMMRSNNVCTVAWNKLYRRTLFEGIRYPVGIKNEDESTTYKLLYKANVVSYMPDQLYIYCSRENSIMHEDLAERYMYFLDAVKGRITYFRDLGENELEQHSMVTLLEWVKYSYRNIPDRDIRKKLVTIYKENISYKKIPGVLGVKKKIGLLLWRYLRY